MHDFQRKGYTQYGAWMGRESNLPHDTTAECTLMHVALDGDYDSGGAYWGGGPGSTPLFCVTDSEGLTGYVRATSSDAAKAMFPNAQWRTPEGPSDQDVNDMLEAYITCALWSSNDNSNDSGGEPLDAKYGADDIDAATKTAMQATVEAFAKANAATILSAMAKDAKCDWSRAGHDLWLNRNGHGCGFWDGGWPEEEGETLSQAAKKLGGIDLCIGDDGRIHT